MKQEEVIEKLAGWRKSPIKFIESMWGLLPQPIICENSTCDHLEVKCYGEFEKGHHLTWHQYLILRAVERSINEDAPKRISVAAGHGCGKSACIAWLDIWFLFTRRNSQIGCTGPSSGQVFDVLHKEHSIWLKRMPDEVQKFFVWQSS
ncbi:MAG: hypothetical protein AABY22_00095, partial [Nanoarchaeota archaeon]